METVNEFSTDHIRHFKAAMDELVASGGDDGFVIFETDEGRFIQFTYSRGVGLTLELPRPDLTEDELQRVCKVDGLEAMNDTEMSLLQIRAGELSRPSHHRCLIRC
jgi:hypothetical protein